MHITKRPYTAPACNFGSCRAHPQWTLRDSNGSRVGIFCGEHADAHMKALNEYAAAIRRTSSENERNG